MNKLMEMLLQTFTGLDGKTIDIGRVLWAQSVFVFFGLSIHALILGQTFSPSEWGIGIGAILAAGGAAIGLKANTEPKD